MSEHAEPIVTAMVQRLAVEQPENVLEFIKQFAEDMLLKTPKLCSVTGSTADMKVKNPSTGEMTYYALDIFDALKRKHKMRGMQFALINEPFPKDEVPEWMESIDPNANLGNNPVEDQPVTPPRRSGFEMTRPGENYHDGPKTSPVNVGPVNFQARALGTESEEGKKLSELGKEGSAAAAAERRIAVMEEKDNLTQEQREQLKVKRKRDVLVGKIQAHYAGIGGVAPLGLAASSIEVLQKHMQKLEINIRAVAQEREEDEHRTDKEHKLKEIFGKQNSTSNHFKEPVVMKFEPRALGVTGTEAPSADETMEQRRQRVAQAAANRLSR